MTVSNSTKQLDYYIKLIELAGGYMRSRILLTALELNIFELIENHTVPADKVAKQLDTDNRAIEVILNALVGMGVLYKKNNLYSNIREIAKLLIPGTPDYQGDMLLHYKNMWKAWSDLTHIVKSGRQYKTEWTKGMSSGLTKAMKHQAKKYAPRLVKLVDCQNIKNMLDIGGGSGAYSIAFTRCYHHLKSTLFDKDPHTLRMAEKEIIKLNLQERIRIKTGDFFHDDMGSGFDFALLSSIICLLGEEEIIRLLDKIKAALSKNGRVIILDMILDESKTKPLPAAIFSVNILIHSPNGRLYSFAEVNNMLELAGFVDVYQIPMGHSKVIIGIKK